MIKDTLYAKYIKDRQDGEILENEFGFITYRIVEKECFIMDMCIDTSKRGRGFGKILVYDLERIALEKGCDVISANVHLWDKGASNTMLAALTVGFEIAQANNNVILIIKKLSGGT